MLNIKKKLILSFLTIIAVMLILSLAISISLRSIINEYDRTIDDIIIENSLTEDTINYIESYYLLAKNINSTQYSEAYYQAKLVLEEKLALLDEQISSRESRTAYNGVRNTIVNIQEVCEDALAEVRKGNILYLSERYGEAHRKALFVEENVGKLIKFELIYSIEVEAKIDKTYRLVMIIGGLALFILALACTTYAIYISRTIANPIMSLTETAKQVKEGKTYHKTHIKTKDEIWQLSEAFDQMMQRLNNSKKKLEEKEEELVKTNKAIAESEQRYAFIINSTGQLIYDYDIRTGAIKWAGAIKEITGHPAGKFKANIEEWKKLIKPQERNNITAELERTMKQKTGFERIYHFKQKNGKYLWVQDKGFYIYGSDGKPKRMLGAMKDISQQKKYEAQLEKTNIKLKELDKQKDAFISVSAHELKTPLTSIKGFTQILQSEELLRNKKKRQHYIELISKNADQLYNLVLDIVDSSRLSLGKLRMQIEAVEVTELFREIKESMEVVLTTETVEPKFIMEKNLPTIKADRNRLMQILRNLLINASHFTHKGSITLAISKKGRFVQFDIKDTGEGIPKENQGRIFSRFYQVDSSMRTKVQGSGLGLSISKGLVNLMGGEIWFSSEPGKGTTFSFTIPAMPSKPKKQTRKK